MKPYDVLIIGAGHNGLTAAAYLAKLGRRVLVLEKNEIPGGTLVTGDFAGFRADLVQSGTLRPSIGRDLKLNLPAPLERPVFTALLPDGGRLELDADPASAAESIRRFSEKDAARWPEFVRFLNLAAAFLEEAYETIIPPLPRPPLGGALDLAELALDLRLTGRKDMLNIIRALAMPVFELVEEYFESEPLRAAAASLGVHGVTLGPLAAGTSFNLIHNWINRGGLAHRFIGRAGDVIAPLMDAVCMPGGEVLTGTEVATVLVEGGVCRGVRLANGEEIESKAVISTADPKRTFLSLVGPMELPPEFVWKVQSIKMRGSVAKVHLGVKSLPRSMTAGVTYAVAPSVMYLEKAYDAAKYGGISEQPYLEVTSAENVISVHFQYTPFALREGDWESAREALEERAIEILSHWFPDLRESIVARKSLTPRDLEQAYGLTEGDLNHGQILLDQIFFMRPLPGYADHRTPIDGLFLGGSGVHGGGGVSGAAGRNAARVVERERRG